MSDEPHREVIAVAEGITKHFKGGPVTVKAVDGVSFRLPRGKIVALRGPSGCGKSTLLNLIGALDRPDSGQLNVDGVDVSRLSGGGEVEYRRRKVGFVFQQFNLVPELSAIENVILPMEFVGTGTNGASQVRARELLEPTANLDSKTGRMIVDLLRSLRDANRTVIIATNDEAIAAKADIILEMRDGLLIAG